MIFACKHFKGNGFDCPFINNISWSTKRSMLAILREGTQVYIACLLCMQLVVVVDVVYCLIYFVVVVARYYIFYNLTLIQPNCAKNIRTWCACVCALVFILSVCVFTCLIHINANTFVFFSWCYLERFSYRLILLTQALNVSCFQYVCEILSTPLHLPNHPTNLHTPPHPTPITLKFMTELEGFPYDL